MRWVASVILALCAVADSSLVWWQHIAVGAPVLTLTTLIALYAILDLRRILAPLIVAGLVLDLYSGLRFGAVTLTLLVMFLLVDLLRGKSLRTEGYLPTFILAIGATLAWIAVYASATIINFGHLRFAVPLLPVALTMLIIAVLAVVMRSFIEKMMAALGYYPKGRSA